MPARGAPAISQQACQADPDASCWRGRRRGGAAVQDGAARSCPGEKACPVKYSQMRAGAAEAQGQLPGQLAGGRGHGQGLQQAGARLADQALDAVRCGRIRQGADAACGVVEGVGTGADPGKATHRRSCSARGSAQLPGCGAKARSWCGSRSVLGCSSAGRRSGSRRRGPSHRLPAGRRGGWHLVPGSPADGASLMPAARSTPPPVRGHRVREVAVIERSCQGASFAAAQQICAGLLGRGGTDGVQLAGKGGVHAAQPEGRF